MEPRERLFLALKWALFPGINLHARLRNSIIPRYLGSAGAGSQRRVLDAGCGNGMLSYQAYLRGNTVWGISLKEREVAGCQRMFNEYLGITEDHLSFSFANLYDLDARDETFDEIICTEVLEHLYRDAEVCRKFWRWLKPGGILHVTAPNAEHPYNQSFPLDHREEGGHVRPGYSLRSFQDLLEPIGFQIEDSMGLGGAVRQAFNDKIKRTEEKVGIPAALLIFILSVPLLSLDRWYRPDMPFSIYVRAAK